MYVLIWLVAEHVTMYFRHLDVTPPTTTINDDTFISIMHADFLF